MNKKRIALIVSVIVIFLICLYYMNIRFNRLSRYPYDNEYATQLMDKYLSDDDIAYVIEYSIAPQYIVDYIGNPGFSIYHVDYYDELHNLRKDMLGRDVVKAVETFINEDIDVSRGITLMQGMELEEVVQYFNSLKDEKN